MKFPKKWNEIQYKKWELIKNDGHYFGAIKTATDMHFPCVCQLNSFLPKKGHDFAELWKNSGQTWIEITGGHSSKPFPSNLSKHSSSQIHGHLSSKQKIKKKTTQKKKDKEPAMNANNPPPPPHSFHLIRDYNLFTSDPLSFSLSQLESRCMSSCPEFPETLPTLTLCWLCHWPAVMRKYLFTCNETKPYKVQPKKQKKDGEQ